MTTKYHLAERLVDKHILACASQLIPPLYSIAISGGNEDIEQYALELENLTGSYDYEDAAVDFIRNEADLDDLEKIADDRGDWADLLAEIGFNQEEVSKAYTDADDRVDQAWAAFMAEDDAAIEEQLLGQHDLLLDRRDALPTDLETWLELNPDKFATLRELVLLLVEQERSGYRDVCDALNLDPSFRETYEFWVVSDFLKYALLERGEVVEEVLGLDVWGRGCTGQAIALDSVIQHIAFDLWGSEVTKTCPADAF